MIGTELGWAMGELFRDQLLDPDRLLYHEAGHAVVAHYHRYTVERAMILPDLRPDDDGRIARASVSCAPPWPDDDEPSWPVVWFRSRTIAAAQLAGLVAERLMVGEHEECRAEWDSDLRDLAMLFQTIYPSMPPSDRRRFRLHAETQAERILTMNLATLDAVTTELRERFELKAADLAMQLAPVRRRRRRASDRRWFAFDWDQTLDPVTVP